jgi:hypothetical protein
MREMNVERFVRDEEKRHVVCLTPDQPKSHTPKLMREW